MNNIITDGKAIDRMIASIAKSTASRQAMIQLAALCSTLHCVVHDRDTTRINKLAEVCNYDASPLRQWAVSTGLWSWVPKAKDKPGHLTMSKEVWTAEKAEFEADAEAYKLKLAGFKPYFEAVKAQEYPEFDLIKYVKAGIAKAKRYQADDKYQGKLKNADFAPRLEQMIAANAIAA